MTSIPITYVYPVFILFVGLVHLVRVNISNQNILKKPRKSILCQGQEIIGKYFREVIDLFHPHTETVIITRGMSPWYYFYLLRYWVI